MCGTVKTTSSDLPNFKVGDTVVLKKDALDFGTVEEGSLFGKALTVKYLESDERHNEEYYDVTVEDEHGVTESFKTSQLEYATSFLTAPIGAEFTDKEYGFDAVVVGRAEGLIALDSGDGVEWYTEENFNNSFVGNEAELKEVTLEEVAGAFGVDTDKIRIKE